MRNSSLLYTFSLTLLAVGFNRCNSTSYDLEPNGTQLHSFSEVIISEAVAETGPSSGGISNTAFSSNKTRGAPITVTPTDLTDAATKVTRVLHKSRLLQIDDNGSTLLCSALNLLLSFIPGDTMRCSCSGGTIICDFDALCGFNSMDMFCPVIMSATVLPSLRRSEATTETMATKETVTEATTNDINERKDGSNTNLVSLDICGNIPLELCIGVTMNEQFELESCSYASIVGRACSCAICDKNLAGAQTNGRNTKNPTRGVNLDCSSVFSDAMTECVSLNIGDLATVFPPYTGVATFESQTVGENVSAMDDLNPSFPMAVTQGVEDASKDDSLARDKEENLENGGYAVIPSFNINGRNGLPSNRINETLDNSSGRANCLPVTMIVTMVIILFAFVLADSPFVR